jgi:hypothetical protein
MTHPPRPAAAYPEPPPDTVCLAALPPRIQRLVALVLAHQDLLCAYQTGSLSLELHFAHDIIKTKFTVLSEG